MEVISYQKGGKHTICFPQKELEKEHAYMSNHMAVLKFSTQRPSFDTIRCYIINEWYVNCDLKMNLMDPRHVIIWFNNAKEIDVALTKNKFFMGISFKIFRWRPGFNTKADPRVLQVLIGIPFLKYEYFSPPFLKEIGDNIG